MDITVELVDFAAAAGLTHGHSPMLAQAKVRLG